MVITSSLTSKEGLNYMPISSRLNLVHGKAKYWWNWIEPIHLIPIERTALDRRIALT